MSSGVMHEVLAVLEKEWDAGRTAALATVVRTTGSAPRPSGTSMLVTSGGSVAGSVSGGCVEAAVYGQAMECISGAVPALVRYGVSDDDAFAAGLTCGGTIEVFIQALPPGASAVLGPVRDAADAGLPAAVATVVEHPDPGCLGLMMAVLPGQTIGSLGSQRATQSAADDTLGLLAAGRSGVLTYGPDGERLETGMSLFVSTLSPRPRMLIFGATDFTDALSRLGSFLGYRVTVCDARPVFATPERFPDADEVVNSWPHVYYRAQVEAGMISPRTVVCVLAHDAKFDIPLLAAVLGGPEVAYAGAMGSRRTHRERMKSLLEAGVEPAALAALHSPIGLDLGARTPEETAVSIAAEFISEARGGTGAPLRLLTAPIHRAGQQPLTAPAASSAESPSPFPHQMLPPPDRRDTRQTPGNRAGSR